MDAASTLPGHQQLLVDTTGQPSVSFFTGSKKRRQRNIVGLTTGYAAIGDTESLIMNNDDETSAAFLVELGQELTTRKGEDAELARIVVEHILVATPAEDCVKQAMAAIDTLAASRATPPEEDADV
jgi:hypothetical protein